MEHNSQELNLCKSLQYDEHEQKKFSSIFNKLKGNINDWIKELPEVYITENNGVKAVSFEKYVKCYDTLYKLYHISKDRQRLMKKDSEMLEMLRVEILQREQDLLEKRRQVSNLERKIKRCEFLDELCKYHQELKNLQQSLIQLEHRKLALQESLQDLKSEEHIRQVMFSKCGFYLQFKPEDPTNYTLTEIKEIPSEIRREMELMKNISEFIKANHEKEPKSGPSTFWD